MARKSDEFKKVLLEEPIRTDLPETLAARLQDVGVHSALAEPTAQFIADLYVEGLETIRFISPATRNPDRAPEDLAARLRRSGSFFEQRSQEALAFIEKVASFLERRVEEDADDTEAFEKNMAKVEKAGRLENARGLMLKLAVDSEDAATHGSWALDNVYRSLVKLIGIVELMRFERASATTLLNGMSEINLDITHRLRPGLLGNEEGRVGLMQILGATAESK